MRYTDQTLTQPSRLIAIIVALLQPLPPPRPSAHRNSAVEHRAQPHPAATLDRSTSIRSLAQLATLIVARLTQWLIYASALLHLSSPLPLGESERRSRRAASSRSATALMDGHPTATASSSLRRLTTMGNTPCRSRPSAHKARGLRQALCSSRSSQRAPSACTHSTHRFACQLLQASVSCFCLSSLFSSISLLIFSNSIPASLDLCASSSCELSLQLACCIFACIALTLLRC